MNLPFARRLGAALSEESTPLRVGGVTRLVRMADVSLSVDGFPPFHTRMGFMPDWEWPWALLGQRGFFEFFQVTFDRLNLRFKLDWARQ